jgi:hypothetical protein
MGKMRVLTSLGDETVVWDKELAEAGDPEALEAVREAERIFEEKCRKGATAFWLSRDAPVRRMDRFDPEAEQVVLVPRVVGG